MLVIALDSFYCTFCGCLVGVHDETGCICENDNEHQDSLNLGQFSTVFEMDNHVVCSCERTHAEFLKRNGWSSEYDGNNLNGTKRHSNV